MTVTLYSWTPPTTHTSRYLLRPTVLNGPRDTITHTCTKVLPDWVRPFEARQVLEDIDDWYSPQIEDDGFLERLDRSAEIVRFP